MARLEERPQEQPRRFPAAHAIEANRFQLAREDRFYRT
jgi:hypothetical protein